jgi:prepilin-type N-terminal cleavage/methylation domain-containing protein
MPTKEMLPMRKQHDLGFTLLELMVSMAVGLIVMAAMASLFKTGMNATVTVQQRAETQQEMRAAVDLIVKDLSMAGAGLPSGGIQLPTGGGATASKFGCDQTATCHVVNFNYPAPNFMYGIVPGFLNGVEGGAAIPAAPGSVNDSVTVVYADYNFQSTTLGNYTGVFVGTTQISLTAVPATAPPLINSAGGIQKGDLIMVSGGGLTAVGEVTNVTASAAGPTGTLTFAAGDPLNFNQSAAGMTGNLASVAGAAGGGSISVTRLLVVTYYLNVPGVAGQTPRLMRQVNGLTPVPVSDDLINLQFAYDTFNSVTNALDANQANPIGAGESPNNIQKINLVVMGQSTLNYGKQSQNLYLATDVSARNMAFSNRYQ